LCFITWLNSALRLHWNIRGFQLILSVSLVQGRKPNIHCRIDSAERANGQPFNCPSVQCLRGTSASLAGHSLSVGHAPTGAVPPPSFQPKPLPSLPSSSNTKKEEEWGMCRQIDAIQDPLFLACKG